ncbi:MAG: hypothetical protein GY895_00475 [Phycisphaera sp.]|nr:hypothetical protein [Phycisphaera sp.]
MIRLPSFSGSLRPLAWSSFLVLVAVPLSCAPATTTETSTPMDSGSNAPAPPSFVGKLDTNVIMGSDADWDPGQAYAEGLAESGDESGRSDAEPVPVAAEGIPPVETIVDSNSTELVLPVKSSEPSLLPLPLLEVDRALAGLAAEADDPVAYEFVRSMLPLLAVEGVGRDDLAFQPSSEDLLADEVEMLEAVGEFATNIRSELASGSSARDALIDRLTTLLQRLRNESSLRMGRVELCTSIAGFGDVDVFSRRMSAGQDAQFLVYAELNGLDWTPKADGRVGWEIRYRLQLHQLSDGMVIDPGVESGIADTLVAAVDDNYLWIRYELPASDLNAGRYVLKLSIREPSTGREDERSIEIDLLPGRLLGRRSSVGGS